MGTTLAPSTSFVNSNLATGTHCYKVQTQAATGTSAQSAAVCNTSLQPPTGITVVKTGTGRLQITWTAAAGANRTYTYESRAGAANAMVASTLIGSAQVVNRAGLTPGVQYCYQLQTQFNPASNPAARSGLTLPVCGVP